MLEDTFRKETNYLDFHPIKIITASQKQKIRDKIYQLAKKSILSNEPKFMVLFIKGNKKL